MKLVQKVSSTRNHWGAHSPPGWTRRAVSTAAPAQKSREGLSDHLDIHGLVVLLGFLQELLEAA